MVDLPHVRTREFGQPPRARVQTGSEDHELTGHAGAQCLVDRDRPRHDHLGARPHTLVHGALPPALRRSVRAHLVHGRTFRGAQQPFRHRVREPAGGSPPVRGRPPLADQHRRPARRTSTLAHGATFNTTRTTAVATRLRVRFSPPRNRHWARDQHPKHRAHGVILVENPFSRILIPSRARYTPNSPRSQSGWNGLGSQTRHSRTVDEKSATSWLRRTGQKPSRWRR